MGSVPLKILVELKATLVSVMPTGGFIFLNSSDSIV
jgi:hypothetical protein